MATDPITYDKSDLRGIIRAFKAMDEQAVSEAKGVSNGLATYLQSKITAAAQGRPNKAAIRIAQGSRVSKSSKIGEISYGFVSQKFSGGGTQNSFGAVTNSAHRNLTISDLVWQSFIRAGDRLAIYLSNIACRTASHHLSMGKCFFTKILKEW
jgi:hypothetical protein